MDKNKKAFTTKYQVRLSENAIENFDALINYIAITNLQPVNAIKVGDAIFERILKIEAFPFNYKECELIPTQTKMYRQTLCFSWYIVYRVVAKQIVILGLIHKSQKPSKRRSLRKFN